MCKSKLVPTSCWAHLHIILQLDQQQFSWCFTHHGQMYLFYGNHLARMQSGGCTFSHVLLPTDIIPVNTHQLMQFIIKQTVPSVLWRCWLGGRKGIWPVKNWVVGCWRGCLGWGADLYIAQQMPLPLTISCSSKSRLVLPFLVLPFWYLLTRVVPDKFQKSSKTIVCVCVY